MMHAKTAIRRWTELHGPKIAAHERGSAYLMIFFIMMLILVLGSGAYFSARIEMMGAMWKKRELTAEYAAEAGINEVLLRLNLPDEPALPVGSGGSGATVEGCDLNAFIGEDPLHPSFPDPSWSATLLSAPCASLPPSSPPDYYMKSLQPNPAEVLYTTDVPAEESLEVTYLKDRWDADADGDESELVFYDPSLPADGLDNANALLFGGDGIADNEPPFHLNTGGAAPGEFPALCIRCTGRAGQGRITLETVAVRKTIVQPIVEGAVMAGGALTGTGFIFISGFNHAYETDPAGWGTTCHLSYYGDGLDNNGDGSDDALEVDFAYDCSHLPAGHSAGAVAGSINLPPGSLIGAPCMDTGGSGVPAAWVCLGMDETAWEEMISRISTDQYPGDGGDRVYILGQAGATTTLSGNGSGLIYSEGSLAFASDFAFKGFIYAEENITASGSPWVCGAVAAGGTILITGDNPSVPATILYCEAAITKLTRFIAYKTLSRTYKERF